MNKKRLTINMIGQICSFLFNLGIGFFITPYIIKHLGEEMYGFVGLANNFTNYITLFTVALSSMLSRYVTIAYVKKDYDEASGYFSTAVITQSVIAIILIGVSVVFINNMEYVINISQDNVPDVKILWLLIFISFAVNIPFGSFSVGTYASNRLEILSIINIMAQSVRTIVLIVVFLFFTPHVWFVGLATVLSSIVTIVASYITKNKLLPEVKLRFKYFDKKYIFNLLIVGFWNSLNRLQQILCDGLDLLIANLFISPADMGLLSVAKMIPTQTTALAGTISNSFEPSLTMVYGKNDKKQFIDGIIFAMKLSGWICSIPVLGFICFGNDFYSLWLPDLSLDELYKTQILSVLVVLPQIISVYAYPFFSINTIMCKLKVPVIISLISGILNVIIVLIMVNITDFGIYAVAGVSSILWVLRIYTFYPIYVAHNLKLKYRILYKPLLSGLLNSIVIGGVFIFIAKLTECSSWISFIITCISAAALGYIIGFIVLFEKKEKKQILKNLKNKWR